MPSNSPLLVTSPIDRSTIVREDPAVVAARLDDLRAVLLAHGVAELSTLGTLAVSGPLIPTAGVSTPSTGVLPARSIVHSALAPGRSAGARREELTVRSWGGTGQSLGVVATVAVSHSIPYALWVANEIILADDTQVVFKYPCASLVLLATRITVGRNVTFTYEHPLRVVPAIPAKPATPADQGTSTTIDNAPAGIDGRPGRPGGRGASGVDGPTVQIWTLELEGHPTFLLAGQDGGRGGTGGDGGDGGRGARGRADKVDSWGFCAAGPGNGGRGGAGGLAGNGGPGGTGGRGGQLNLYAPAEVLQRYITSFVISIEGGRGGAGGWAGYPGLGGPGGSRGDNGHNCKPSSPRHDGQPGPIGQRGKEGPVGQNGEAGGVAMSAIAPDALPKALSLPRVVSLSVPAARVGDPVTLLGANLLGADQIWVGRIDRDPVTGLATIPEAVRAEVSYGGDTILTLVVPGVPGGMNGVQVRRSDGTRSNVATLYVSPVLESTEPEGRIWPGSRVRFRGSGFAQGALVLVNGTQAPDVRFIDPSTLEATVIRPDNVAPQPSGELVTIQVMLADGGPYSASSTLDAVLETIRLHVIGDSIAWGQGLLEADKVSSRLMSRIQAANGGIGVYQSRTAHSGAVIGVGDSAQPDPLDGEVPYSYPTVLEQVRSFTDSPETVDLVLLSAGINDVRVQEILTGSLTGPDLSDRIERHCHDHMVVLLERVHDRFPNAVVLVTGYYQIVSEHSDLGLLGALLIAMGAAVGPAVPVLEAAAFATITKRCSLFHTHSRDALRRAVVDVVGDGPTWAHFVDPGFTPEHAALAPNTRLWGIAVDLSPQDTGEVAHRRAIACFAAGDRTPWYCEVASTGHPNPTGAAAYATALAPLALASVGGPKKTPAE